MKIFALVSVFSALVIVSDAAPQSSVEHRFVTEDDLLGENIANNLRVIKKLGDSDIVTSILNSVDQKCVLRRYKKYKLESELTQEALDFLNLENRPIDPVLIFANIALTCSNKLNALLGFVFDNLFSYSGLLDAFREDEPFKEFIDDLICYNNYAVKENFIDPIEYPNLQYKLVNHTEAECEESVKDLKESLTDTIEFVELLTTLNHPKCLEKEVSSEAEKFFLKYALLVPLGLTDDQRKRERVNFIADVLQGLEKLLSCNIKKEQEELKDNEISNQL